MSEEKGLLAAIRDNPEDDDLRRVYADWLEEHGRSDRAEFLRLQVDLAARREGIWEERYCHFRALERREAELFWEHGAAWLSEMPSLEGIEWRFERGLPSWVSFDDF